LRQLPTNEALKHTLIQAAGSLRQAYRAMDIAKTGTLNCEQFELGLKRLNIGGPRIAGFGDAPALFRILDFRGTGELSLSDLLGYFPVKKRERFKDTGVLVFDYANKASAQRSRLARAPRWQMGSPGESRQMRRRGIGTSDDEAEFPRPWGSDPDAYEQQRRDLRRRLVDTKGDLPMHGKRAMVAGLVAPENYAEVRMREKNAAIVQQRRIKDAIGACSRARSDLVGLTQAMRQVAAPEKLVTFTSEQRRYGIQARSAQIPAFCR